MKKIILNFAIVVSGLFTATSCIEEILKRIMPPKIRQPMPLMLIRILWTALLHQ